ncbi:MAG: diguanylate cyclase, partial [Methylotenera sp.]|nr:diguanylate cyclase [Methylotenera sp.]
MTNQKTIRGEIRYLAMASVIVALGITFLMGVVYKIITEREEAQSELKVLAQITAINSQPALLFKDKLAAEEILAALSPNSDIVSAEITTASGEVLARKKMDQGISAEGGQLTTYVSQLLRRLLAEGGCEMVEHTVTLNGEVLGKVAIESVMLAVWLEIIAAIIASIVATGLAVILSLLLIRNMLDDILKPIAHLSESASKLAKSKQYSQRVPRLADDELGELTDQFNQMLNEVERRDKDLLAQNSALENEVKNRTQVITQSMEEMRSLMDSMAEGAYGVDADGNCKFVNAAFLRILGYTSAEEILGKNVHALIHHSHAQDKRYPMADCKIMTTCMQNKPLHATDEVFWRKDNTPVPVEYWSQPMLVDGVVKGVTTTFVDISERKQSEAELKVAATAFEAQESMMVMDAGRIILRVNKAFTEITGYAADEVIGKSGSLFRSGREDENYYQQMWSAIDQQGFWQGEVWNRRKNGTIYPGKISISAVKNQQGDITHYVSTLTDITKTKAAEQEIRNLAFFDSLTGLPNRRLLLDRLSQALTFSARSGREGALLFIDLDHFKTLNDTMGHAVGDMLLQQIAARLSASVREGDTVARLGGDEFVVMLEDLSEHAVEAAAQTEAIGEKILQALAQPYQLEAHEHHSTASIGATLFNDHEADIDELLKQADIAMYQAKKAGRNTLRFFDPEMQASINTRAALEAELRKALERQQFKLHYQLQVDAAGQPVGAEALIRWQHPSQGLVSPYHFIPLAEETGLIIPIGEWVLNTACQQLHAWQQRTGTQHLTLSINVSAKQFRQPDFVQVIQQAVSQHQINPAYLKLELTESMLLEHMAQTIA